MSLSRAFHFVFCVLPTQPTSRGLCVCAVNETGSIPPGNAKGNTTWSIKRSAPKPELKLTPGKGLQDLTCSVEDLVDQVVKTNKVLLLCLPTFAVCERPALAHLHNPFQQNIVQKDFYHALQVVAFVKGTRTQPQCGFSYKVLSILNESKVSFEVVGTPFHACTS